MPKNHARFSAKNNRSTLTTTMMGNFWSRSKNPRSWINPCCLCLRFVLNDFDFESVLLVYINVGMYNYSFLSVAHSSRFSSLHFLCDFFEFSCLGNVGTVGFDRISESNKVFVAL